MCLPANYISDHSEWNSEGEESNASPAIWNELKPCIATVVGHGGKKDGKADRKKEWKAVGGHNGSIWPLCMVEGGEGGGEGDVKGLLGMGIPPF